MSQTVTRADVGVEPFERKVHDGFFDCSSNLTRGDDAPEQVTTPLVESYKQSRIKAVDKVTVNTELNVPSAVLTYARHLKLPCGTPTITRCRVSKKKGLAKAYTRQRSASSSPEPRV